MLKHSIDAGIKEGGLTDLDLSELKKMSDVYYYLRDEHDFSAAEIVALMRFADPLEVAAVCWAERGPSETFPICDLLEQTHAYEHHRTLYLPMNEIVEVVKKMLEQNMSEYQASLMSLDKPELVAKSAEIAAMQEALDFMKNYYVFQKGDADTLLRMENPLRFVAEQWPSDIGGLLDMNSQVGEAIKEAAKVSPYHGERTPAQVKVDIPAQAERPSIREQLRDAARDTGQHQQTESRNRGGNAR